MNVKKAFVTTLALAALVAIALVGGRADAAQERQTSTLVGTGATFPFPLISKWIPEVGKAYGIDLTYSPTGSGAGIAAVTSRTVDFGASDAPLRSTVNLAPSMTRSEPLPDTSARSTAPTRLSSAPPPWLVQSAPVPGLCAVSPESTPQPVSASKPADTARNPSLGNLHLPTRALS